MADRGFIYLVKCGPHYKIGRSLDPKRRFRELFPTLLPYPGELLMQIPVSDMARAERALHRRFAPVRMHGEWFALEGADLCELLRIKAIDYDVGVLSANVDQSEIGYNADCIDFINEGL